MQSDWLPDSHSESLDFSLQTGHHLEQINEAFASI